MRLYLLLTLRSFKLRPLRIVLSTFGIILGVAGMLSIQLTNQTALQSITRLFESTSGRSNLVITSTASGEGMPEQLLRIVAAYPRIRQAAPVLQAQTVLADGGSEGPLALSFFGANNGGLLLYGIDPLIDGQVREYRLTEGRFLSQEATGREVVLVENYAEEEEIKVGERLRILTPNGVEVLRVVGLIAREGAGQMNNGAFGVVPLKTLQELFNRPNKLDQIDLVVEERTSQSSIESLRQGLQNRLGKEVSVIYPAGQGQRMAQMLGNYQIGLNFLSGIALFVGAFLIYNAFAMTVVERTREFGMLRTVGMTRQQVITHLMLEAVLLGFIGATLGAAAGIFLSRGLVQLMAVILGQELDTVNIAPSAILISMGIGLFVTILAALLPAYQAGRISPMAALRIRGKQNEGWLLMHGWKIGIVLLIGSTAILIWNPFAFDVQFRLGSMTVFMLFLGATLMIPVFVSIWERLTRPVMQKIYGSSGNLGSRNVQRSKMRTTLTVAALMIGVAMILIVRAMTASFASDLLKWIEAYLGGDVYVTSSVPLRSDIGKRLESAQGVAAVAAIRYQPVEWQPPDGDIENITFMAVEPAAYTSVTRFVFSDSQTDQTSALTLLAKGDAVFISSVIAEKYGLKTGDEILIRTKSGLRPFRVAAVVVDFFNQGMVVTGNWNDLRRYFRVNDASTFLVRAEQGFSAEEVIQQIDRLFGKRYRLNMETNQSIRSRVLTLMNQAFSMFDVMAVLAVLVASLGIINTLTMNVIERTREIGMLRAIGMTRGQLILMILAEAAQMGVVGGGLGLVLGILLARIFLQAMMAMSGYRLDFVLPVQGVIASLVVALVISQLAAILPARRAARSHILDAIHYE